MMPWPRRMFLVRWPAAARKTSGAVESLRRVRRTERKGDELLLSAVDPLNLAGVLASGARINSIHTNSVLFRDGLPSDAN